MATLYPPPPVGTNPTASPFHAAPNGLAPANERKAEPALKSEGFVIEGQHVGLQSELMGQVSWP